MRYIEIRKKPYTKNPLYAKDPTLVADDKWSIGSALTKGGAVYKGINPQEEVLLMPHILGLSADNSTFISESNSYFSDTKRIVPETGIKLCISLVDDDKPLSKDNMPISVEDYVFYRYCLGFPTVGKTKEELNWNNKALFYIYSEEEQIKKDSITSDSIVQAIREFTKIEENEYVMENVIRVISGQNKGKRGFEIPIQNLSKLTKEQKKTILVSVAKETPKLLIKAVEDKDLEKKAEIYQLLDNNIIEQVGNSYIYSGEEIGRNIDQVVAFIKAASNSKLYITMKAKLDSINGNITSKKKKEEKKEEVIV